MDFPQFEALELGRAIAEGKVSSVEITRHFLSVIDSSDVGSSIYARTMPERALAEAEASDERTRSSQRLSPLDGVPGSWKDLFDTKDVATESGAPLLKGRIPKRDAVLVQRATGAGMVALGKTHQTEFAFSGLGINPKTETPPNRLMPGRVPGGSSSGAAASLTHDMASVAIGSDTGGSVRIPAAWNSLVGLKTTHGALPSEGMVPLCSGFDTAGPLARSVSDAAAMFQVLKGVPVRSVPVPDFSEITLAIVETIAMEDIEARQLQPFEEAVRRLEVAGVRVERIKRAQFGLVLDLGAILFPYEAWREWGDLIEANPGVMFPPVEMRFRQGANITGEQYLSAFEELERLQSQFFLETEAFDAVIMPTIPIEPPPIDALLADHDLFTAKNLIALRNTRFANLFGTCALTLPTAEPAAGFQIMGKPNSEDKLLGEGLALERIIAGRS